MKRIWVSLVAAGLLTIAALAPAAGQSIFSVPLDDVDDSGVTGGASVRGVDGQVEVTVFISEGDEGGEHPVHVHEGTCEELGDVAYPLENITDGESVTTLDLELSELMTGDYAINAHQSEDEMDVNIMCGNVPAIEGLGADDEEEEAAEDDEADDDEAEEDEAAEEEADDADDEDAMDDEDGEDDAAEDEEEDVADVAPDAGMTGGSGGQTSLLLMTVLAGGAVGGGLLIRSRLVRA